MLRVDDDPLKIVPPKNLNTGNSKDSLGGLSFNASKVSCFPFLLRKKCNQASNGWDFRADAESSAHDPPPVQYAQIGIGRWTWGLKKCPAPILHQVKERPCREHLAWRWNGNWNMARATKNVWKLQPRIFRWKDVTRNIQGEQNHSAIWVHFYTQPVAGWAAVKCHGKSLFFNLAGPRAFGPETHMWDHV